ncbi:protein mono-ADP-ribosyltransferase PARP14-like [Mercenaria mercenaria]|uniref:protein mono-ADP-ribosyltransferase PARP14-like n=1 Tax=Mercenaria mercenaria TaxID=6596 RepID=UPI00234F0A19|nr:protein mono-ADP-ribosyltransferase PARP14-like [Mercenaria mercenaria]
MTSETFIFDNVSVALKAGDLTEDDAKCIICWLEEYFTSTKGAVTTALLKKCGQLLADELDNIKQDLTTNKIGFTSAPGLKSEFIMHVAVKPYSVRETMIKCLKKAEEEKIESVAFPALAASRKGVIDPSADLLSNMMYWSAGIPDVYTTNEGTLTLSQISKEMTKAVKEFAKTKPKYLTDIRFVIYQPSMMDDFRKALGKGFDAKDNLAGTFFKGARYCIGKMMSNTNEEQTERNTVTFDILSTSDEVIQQAIRKLDSSLEKEILTKTFNDDIIQHLDESQILKLMNIARQQQVVADIDIAKRIVTITGMSNNMLDASDKFHLFFKEAIQMHLIADIVQWYVIIISKTGEEVEPYEKEVNLRLEEAYRQKKKYVTYTSEDVEYVVDFDAMEEYPKNDKDDVAKVIRRESFKPRSFPLPTTWDDMNGVNLRVVTLKPTSKEYDEIEQTFLKSAAKRATYIVNKIDRIQNVTLWEQYMTKKKQLDEQNPPGTQNEQLLWHGTREDAVDSINAHGFNRRFCGENATAYGNGVYFAVDASYSCSETYSRPNRNGIKRMYYCRVLSGEYAKGESGMKVPPPKPSGGHHALFDSVVNNMMNPNMFVIFHDTQACPEYLIQFKSA